MQIHRKMALLALLVSLACASVGHAAIFSVDRTLSGGGGTGGTVVGTITTDDTIGVLSTAKVTDWDLLLTAGGSSFTLLGPLSGNNSELLVSGSALSATATELIFDFSSTGFALFQNPNIGSSENWWCVEGPSSGCTPFGQAATGVESVQVGFVGNDTFGTATYDTAQVIGTTAAAVPEPSTLALLSLGLAGLGLIRRRRNHG